MTVLCLLPGLDGTTRMLTAFADASRAAGIDRVDAIAYPVERALDYAELETFARDRLPTRTPFVLLGESFSGPIAIRIASDPPPNLVGLVLSTTFARAPVPLLSSLASLTRFAPVRGLPTAALSFALLGPWNTPALRRDLLASLHAVAPAVLRARAAAALRADVEDHLSRIEIPTLLLRAKHDRLLRSGTSRRLLAGIAHAKRTTFDGPHLLLQTQADDCARAVAAFVRAVSRDGLKPPATSSDRPERR